MPLLFAIVHFAEARKNGVLRTMENNGEVMFCRRCPRAAGHDTSAVCIPDAPKVGSARAKAAVAKGWGIGSKLSSHRLMAGAAEEWMAFASPQGLRLAATAEPMPLEGIASDSLAWSFLRGKGSFGFGFLAIFFRGRIIREWT
jgi:hypothetical protein